MAKSNVDRLLAAAGAIVNPDTIIPTPAATVAPAQSPAVIINGRPVAGERAEGSQAFTMRDRGRHSGSHYSMGVTNDINVARDGSADTYRITLPNAAGEYVRFNVPMPIDGGPVTITLVLCTDFTF